MELSVDFREVSENQRIKIMKKDRYTGKYPYLFISLTLSVLLCLVARLVLSEPQLRVEVEYT